MLTASGLDRAAACPASEALPASYRTNEYASQGRVIHRFLQLCQEQDRDSALAITSKESPELLAICAAINTDILPVDGQYAAEVAFSIDYLTGKARELGRGIDRRYDITETEIPGTMDVVGVSGDVAFVDDFKTGHLEQPRASESLQIRFGVTAAMLAYGKNEAVGRIIRVIPGEPEYFDSANFDSFDAAIFVRELASIRANVDRAAEIVANGGIPDVTEGDHCRYCPALYSCPAKTALVRSLAKPLATPEDMVGAITHDTAAKAWLQLQKIDAVAKLVKDRIYSLARSQPIPLGNGEFLGETIANGNERLDGDGTYQAVKAMWGDEAAELAAPASRSATKKGLDEAARIAKERGMVKSVAGAKRDVLEQLRETGCARTPRVCKVRQFSAPECINDNCNEQAMQEGSVCRDCAIDAEFSEVIK